MEQDPLFQIFAGEKFPLLFGELAAEGDFSDRIGFPGIKSGEGEFEDDVFVLYTASDTIFRSLNKENHAELIRQAFAEMGMQESGYQIRLKGKQSDDFNKNLNEIKETFGGIKIEIK